MTKRHINWKTTFLDHKNQTGIHSVRDLLSIKNLTTDIDADSPTPTWYRMSRERDLLFMFISPNGMVSITHHVDLIGNRLSNAYTAVGLVNFSHHAPPVEFDIATNLIEISNRVPDWAEFEKHLESPATFTNLEVEPQDVEDDRVSQLISEGHTPETANKTRAPRCKIASVIGIPLGLCPPILDTNDNNPASLAITIWNRMTELDEEHEGVTEGYAPYRTHFRHLIRYLWLASKQKIHPMSYVLTEDQDALDWCDRLHCAYLTQANLISPLPANSATTTPTGNDALEKVVYALSSAIQSSSHQTKKDKDDSETQGFSKRFGPHLQLLFLNASATEPYEEAAKEPTETFEIFYPRRP
jgi:hypothetical protein